MREVLLVLHLFVSIALVTVILLQRSEGGGLGIGGGPGGLMSVRGAGNLLTRLTTYLAIAFLGLAIAQAVILGASRGASSLMADPASQGAPAALPALPTLEEETRRAAERAPDGGDVPPPREDAADLPSPPQ
ncbi:MAG: preprotein translocase subunit SecG [Pseudomonadota bacterium]